jgi:molybdopterin synthase sulfur carrier subunit
MFNCFMYLGISWRQERGDRRLRWVKLIYYRFWFYNVERFRVGSLRVKVEYVGHIRTIIGSEREEEVEISDRSAVADLLAKLAEKYGASFKKAIYEKSGADVKPNYIVTVNGCLLNQLNGVETKLRNGDQVTLLPIVSGG